MEWYRCPSEARVACRDADVCRVCSRARRRSRHRLTHRVSLAFTMLTFPCFMEEPWRARLAASLLRLRIPGLVMSANVSAQAQSRCQAYARGAKPTWASDLGTPEGLDSVVVDRQC